MHIWYVYDMAVRLWFLHIKLEFAHIHGNHNGKVGGSIAIVWATYFAVIYGYHDHWIMNNGLILLIPHDLGIWDLT